MAANSVQTAAAPPAELESAIATGATVVAQDSHAPKPKTAAKVAKGLENVDESKHLHGRQLYLAFGSMLLTLLLV